MSKKVIEVKKSTLYLLGIISLIAFVGFFMLKENNTASGSTTNGKGEVQKIVLGMKNYNYYPNTIKVKVGRPVSISLDSSVTGCFRSFTIKELGVLKYVKTPQETIDFTPTKKGTFRFACGMGMGTGTLIVE